MFFDNLMRYLRWWPENAIYKVFLVGPKGISNIKRENKSIIKHHILSITVILLSFENHYGILSNGRMKRLFGRILGKCITCISKVNLWGCGFLTKNKHNEPYFPLIYVMRRSIELHFIIYGKKGKEHDEAHSYLCFMKDNGGLHDICGSIIVRLHLPCIWQNISKVVGLERLFWNAGQSHL